MTMRVCGSHGSKLAHVAVGGDIEADVDLQLVAEGPHQPRTVTMRVCTMVALEASTRGGGRRH